MDCFDMARRIAIDYTSISRSQTLFAFRDRRLCLQDGRLGVAVSVEVVLVEAALVRIPTEVVANLRAAPVIEAQVALAEVIVDVARDVPALAPGYVDSVGRDRGIQVEVFEIH